MGFDTLHVWLLHAVVAMGVAWLWLDVVLLLYVMNWMARMWHGVLCALYSGASMGC